MNRYFVGLWNIIATLYKDMKRRKEKKLKLRRVNTYIDDYTCIWHGRSSCEHQPYWTLHHRPASCNPTTDRCEGCGLFLLTYSRRWLFLYLPRPSTRRHDCLCIKSRAITRNVHHLPILKSSQHINSRDAQSNQRQLSYQEARASGVDTFGGEKNMRALSMIKPLTRKIAWLLTRSWQRWRTQSDDCRVKKPRSCTIVLSVDGASCSLCLPTSMSAIGP